jgi:hypothetical protein
MPGRPRGATGSGERTFSAAETRPSTGSRMPSARRGHSGVDLSSFTDPPGETKGQTEEREQPSGRRTEQFCESDKASHHYLSAGIHWGHIGWLRRAEPCLSWLRASPPPRPQPLGNRPARARVREGQSALTAPHLQTGGRATDLLLANRRPRTVWISTVLRARSLSALLCPSLDRATGTTVARSSWPACGPVRSARVRLRPTRWPEPLGVWPSG